MDEGGKNSTLWIRMVSFEKIKIHGISKKKKKKEEEYQGFLGGRKGERVLEAVHKRKPEREC